MKQVKLNTLGDRALFMTNLRTNVIWQIQTPGSKVSASAKVSGITRPFKGTRLVWVKDE